MNVRRTKQRQATARSRLGFMLHASGPPCLRCGVSRQRMSALSEFLSDVIKAALTELREDPIQIYTFAFYHDHESGIVSVCGDSKESSTKLVRSSNQWSMGYFAEHIQSGSWKDACLFQANVGRSLSLGDFARVNLAETDLDDDTATDESFYIEMARAVIAHQREILELAPEPDEVVFCCSSADSEVGLIWSRL